MIGMQSPLEAAAATWSMEGHAVKRRPGGRLTVTINICTLGTDGNTSLPSLVLSYTAHSLSCGSTFLFTQDSRILLEVKLFILSLCKDCMTSTLSTQTQINK